MQGIRSGLLAVLTAAAAGCGGSEDAGDDLTWQDDDAADVALQKIVTRVQLTLDSVDARLRTVPNLTARERRRLRRDVNEVQIERAKQLGVRAATGDIQRLVDEGRLVPLADSSQHWVVRELDHSVPYVTPDAHAMLVELGTRFQARLDSLGVPRYRLDITSVLRTPEKQAELRRRNANASRTESSHEFATTVDVAYRRFAAPAQPLPDVRLSGQARTVIDSMYVDVGRDRGAELQAVLGRVIQEMQAEGRLLVVMERSQTVYHMTVARRYPSSG